jgi:DNA-binding NarL/FixJ family response regulator
MTHQERRPRVVLADDHPAVLNAFCRILQRSCDVVAGVPNGREAVDAVSKLNPDVLIVDLMMPDLDGLEVCRKVKSVSPATEVIIVTAFDDSGVEEVALRDGAAAFVSKHSAVTTLEKTIHRLFAARQSIPK